MDACPVIRISPLAAIGLWLAMSGSLAAQGRFFHTAEPPLADADDGIQLAAAQMPAGNSSLGSVGVPVVRVNVIAPSVLPSNKSVTYRLQVDNPSSMAASNVRVMHPLNGMKFVQADPKPLDPNAPELEWAFGKLEAGDRREITVTVTPANTMEEFNAVAKVRFEHGRQMKIKLSKLELSMRFVMQRDVQQYDIVPVRLEINNPSPMEVKDIQVSVTLPEGVIFHVEPTGMQPADGTNSGKSKNWTVARIGPYETHVVNFNVVGVETGRATLGAFAGLTANPEKDAKFELNVQAPQLEVTATGPQNAMPQQAVSYRVAVKNGGTFAMRNVTVVDRLPAKCQFVHASDGGQSFDEEVQWIIPILQPGETRSLELTVKQPESGTVTHQFVATYRRKWQQKDVATLFSTERKSNQF